MKKYSISFITRLPLICWLTSIQLSLAANDPDQTSRQSDTIQQQQQQQIQQDQLKASPPRPPDGADLKQLIPKSAKPAGIDGQCHAIQTIDIQHSNHLSPEMRLKITNAFAGHCLSAEDINTILAWITRDYVEHGFITTRAYLPAQDIKDGTLIILVIEGSIQHFLLEDKNSKSVSVKNVFPKLEGKILNLRDLEQGVDQINRLQSNAAKLDIQPGPVAGESVIVIHNEPKFPLHLLADLDNEGTPATGKDQAAATLTADNLGGFNELMALTLRSSLNDADLIHKSDSSDFLVQLPFGYNTFGFDTNHSSYTNQFVAPSGGKLTSYGSNDVNSVDASRMVYRDQKSRLLLSTSLTTKNSKNYLQNQYLSPDSRSLTDFNGKATLSGNISGNLVTLSLTYTKGLPTLGALENSHYLPGDEPHAQFQKVAIDTSLKVPFQMLNQNFSYDTSVSAQRSGNPLYSSEQMLIGTLYTVRGFLTNNLSGDNGYFWRNDIALKKQITVADLSMNARFFIGLDHGCVSNLAPGLNSGCLTGASVGVSAQWKDFTWDLLYSNPIKEPTFMVRESNQFWVRFSASM